MQHAAFIGKQPGKFRRFVGRPVPDHVVAAPPRPQIVVGTGDRIAEKLLAGRQAEGHGIKEIMMDRRRQRVLSQHGAPGDVTGIERHDRGQTRLPHGRAQPIGSDQHVALRRAAVGKAGHNPARHLFE